MHAGPQARLAVTGRLADKPVRDEPLNEQTAQALRIA
jgi:hypothetical protein